MSSQLSRRNTHTKVSQEGMKINSSWSGRVWDRALGKHKKGDGA